jgi:hypothetical protein
MKPGALWKRFHSPTRALWALAAGWWLASSGGRAAAQEPPLSRFEAGQAKTVLVNQLAQIEQELVQLENRLADLEPQARDLLERLAAAERPMKKPPEQPQRRGARSEGFRPPLYGAAQATKRIQLLCEEGRVTVMHEDPIAAAAEAADQQIAAARGTGQLQWKGLIAAPEGHFDVRYQGQSRLGSVERRLELVRKPGHGETADQLANPAAEISQMLATLDPARTMLLFHVYPDSYDIFRAVRAEAWKRNFEIGWEPLAAGAPFGFEVGPSGPLKADH